MKREFISFKEYNDWEGEVWEVFIPLEENREAIELLKKHFEKLSPMFQEAFSFDKVVTESEAETLAKHSDCGYMDRYSIFDGKLNPKPLLQMNEEELFDALYKGKIYEYLEAIEKSD